MILCKLGIFVKRRHLCVTESTRESRYTHLERLNEFDRKVEELCYEDPEMDGGLDEEVRDVVDRADQVEEYLEQEVEDIIEEEIDAVTECLQA